MVKFIFFLFGFGLVVTSCTYIIIYLNLLSIGYNFYDYVNFIFRRIECLNFFIGIFIMFNSFPKEETDEFYIRYNG